ncbi:MAG: SDR family NAD(P)-dependent oxidoreductase [Bacteroidetes bacterium]|nr:SDR family NAD(P)-dependent oxidoreductase [Bacteroidota bacterium]
MSVHPFAVITGASSGIGEACARRFASGGWHLMLLARRAERLYQLSEQLQQEYGVQVHALVLDVRHKEHADELARWLVQHQQTPDLLINNAGLAVGLDPIHAGQIDDWERMIDTNIKGLLYITRVISPMMVERCSGHIINIGSIAGKEAYPNGNVYCATKHAVDGLTRAMRMDLYAHGIRVTQVAPGAVETEFSEVRFKGDSQRAAKVYENFRPLTAGDVADVVWYCANVPPHVSIHDVVVMPAAQASATMIHRG